MKLKAKELRVSEPTEADLAKIKRRDIYIICDNVLDTYNIGSIFRLADAVGAKCVYLCGESEIPPNPRIHKASIGTDKWVPWQYFADAKGAISKLREEFSLRSNNKTDTNTVIPAKAGIQKSSKRWIPDQVGDDKLKSIRIVAIEQAKGSVDFRKIDYKQSFSSNREPIAFVVGHETDGVSKETLKVCDQIVEIPMFGVNISLNVMVSLAIVLFRAI